MRPELIGGTATPTLFDSPELDSDELPTRLELISAHVPADGCISVAIVLHHATSNWSEIPKPNPRSFKLTRRAWQITR